MTIESGSRLPQLFAAYGADTPTRLYYFMRTADCPVCRQHVKRLSALYDELSRRAVSVVVFAPGDDEATLPAYAAELPFPFVVSRAAHAAAGFDQVLGALQQSGTVVADQAGTVLFVRRATLPFKAFPEAEVLALTRERSPDAQAPGQLSLA